MHCLLTSLSGTFALNVYMAPFSVLFEGAALLVASAAMVALEGLLYCEKEFQLFTSQQKHPQHLTATMTIISLGGFKQNG